MKRKLFIVLISFLTCLCCIIPFAGCSDGWQEVQSITYTTDSESKTLTSYCQWDLTAERIEQDEYDNAPEELKKTHHSNGISTIEGISGNLKDFKSDINKRTGKTYFWRDLDAFDYEYTNEYYNDIKVTYNSYTLNLVKIKIIDENTLEIDYRNQIIKILATSYKITYFSN